jgi:hypothetical protein
LGRHLDGITLDQLDKHCLVVEQLAAGKYLNPDLAFHLFVDTIGELFRRKVLRMGLAAGDVAEFDDDFFGHRGGNRKR